MKFWDASATVPLLLQETATGRVRQWLGNDSEIIVWWGTAIECASAIHRGEREGRLTHADVVLATKSLGELQRTWQEIEPTDRLRELTYRLLRAHPLRAADALQLAAALVAANQRPSDLEFVCLDDRLAAAARREGFSVLS